MSMISNSSKMLLVMSTVILTFMVTTTIISFPHFAEATLDVKCFQPQQELNTPAKTVCLPPQAHNPSVVHLRSKDIESIDRKT